ncbi:unnamed protein product [Rhizophagus irregularis]|nr:unnamed protein product [Rhizophagus irregularis]
MSVFDQKTSCRMVNFRGQDEESTNKNTELEEQEDNEIPKKTNVKKFKEQIKTPIRIYFVVEDHEIFRRIYLLGIVKKESNVEFYDQVITLPEAEERFEMMQFPKHYEEPLEPLKKF